MFILNLITWWSVQGNGMLSSVLISMFCLKMRSRVWPEACVGAFISCYRPSASSWLMQALVMESWEDFAQRLKSPSSRRFLVFKVYVEMNSIKGARKCVFAPGGL